MTRQTHTRLFGVSHALASPVVRVAVIAIIAIFMITPVLILALRKAGKVPDKQYDELMKRYKSWLILGPLMIVPVLLGAFWTIMAVGILSILCYREYARATGLFREKLMSLLVTAGILAVTFSVLDNWYGLFVALFPLATGAIAAIAIFADRPKGYIQRVALSILAFTLFGVCLGHLGFFANDDQFRPILFWLVICVELNDIFAYICGKSFGHRKIAPQTRTMVNWMDAWKLEPAHDFGLPLAERLKSANRESGLVGTISQAVWWRFVRIYLRGFHRLNVTGKEHLPKEPPFVLVANHQSHLDALVLASQLPRAQR